MTVTAISGRTDAFRQQVVQYMELMEGQQAAAAIVDLYAAEMAALGAQIEGIRHEAASASAAAQSNHLMVQQLHAHAARGLWTGARQAAELSGMRSCVDKVRHMCNTADDGSVQGTDVLAALSAAPPVPVHTPTMIAFEADRRFRAGRFVSVDHTLTMVYPCVGWALVDHGPGAASSLEPVFLVDDRCLARSVIETEYGLRMEMVTPAITLTEP